MKPPPRPPQRVTILGLGLFGGGVGAARYFAEHGAHVTVTDRRDAGALRESLEALADLPIEFQLGGHRESAFTNADLVIVNPAVPPTAPALEMARRSGARLETALNLIFELSPAPIAAVTGTNGKSTTAALLGEMMRAAGRGTWLGGNLGGSLLPEIEQVPPDDIVVLEVSSFQAQRLAWAQRSPHLAVALNITPNHLDRHPDMADYIAAKRQLFLYQQPGDFAVLNAADPIVRAWSAAGEGEKFFLGAVPSAPSGARLEGAHVHLWRQDATDEVALNQLRLSGEHNRFNAACAAAAAWLLGAEPHAIEKGIARFPGLPDRLEFVAAKEGVRFYNDSIATNPESTEAALEAFGEPLVLIAGGSSKRLSFQDLGRKIVERVKAVVLIGATAGEIEAAIRAAGGAAPILRHAQSLDDAVGIAAGVADAGEVVLLSPACASYDMFRNYAERGRMFREAVRALPARAGETADAPQSNRL